MKNSIGLGRGLGAILDVENIIDDKNPTNHLEDVDVALIVPNPKQPRTHFDEEALEELADSIKTLGLIQPITVRKEGEKYTIISGERRWRASKMAGLETVPAYIREADDQYMHEMSLVENIQRQDLNAMEIAVSLQRLIDECGVTQDTVATRVGKKRSTVANYLRLLALPAEVQIALKQNLITMGHAKAIAAAPEETKLAVLHKCLKKGLSVRATEELVRKLSEQPSKERAANDEEFPENYTRLVERLSGLLTEDITIKRLPSGGGKITIGFSSDKEIDGLIEKIENLAVK